MERRRSSFGVPHLVPGVQAFEVGETGAGVSSRQAEEGAAGFVEGLCLFSLETSELIGEATDADGVGVVPLDVGRETPVVKSGRLQSHGSEDLVFAFE
jgi:hypothetical protein